MRAQHPFTCLLLLFCMLPLMGSRNVGSAKKLLGTTYSMIFFVSDHQSSWTKNEKKQMLQLLVDAEDWLVEQGKGYGQSLVFDHGLFGWEEDIKLASIPEGTRSGNEDVRLTNKIIRVVGYQNQQQILDQIKADNIQLLFFFKKDGVSYSFPFEKGLSKEFYLEGMAIYHQFRPKVPQCRSCIAHEILHVFGAWDFYKSFQTTQAQEYRAKKDFPNSVMLRTSYTIKELTIDPVTAWRIGWSEQEPKGASFFRPNYP